jgi:hypothetical protein
MSHPASKGNGSKMIARNAVFVSASLKALAPSEPEPQIGSEASLDSSGTHWKGFCLWGRFCGKNSLFPEDLGHDRASFRVFDH